MSFAESWRQSVANAINWLLNVDQSILNRLTTLETKVTKLMSDVDDLNAAVDATDAKIDAAAALIPQLKQAIVDLTAQLASAPNDSVAIQAAIAKLNSHADGLAAALNPPAPVVPATP